MKALLSLVAFVFLLSPALAQVVPAPPETWLDRLERDARSILGRARTDLDQFRAKIEARDKASADLTNADAWMFQTRDVFDHDRDTLTGNMDSRLDTMAHDVESDTDAEYQRLRRHLRLYVEDAKLWAEKLKTAAKDELADAAEEGLSAARAVLRDLSSNAPKPVPAPVVPPINSTLTDVALPMQTSSFPPRPGPYISLGNPFFGEGYIGPGFKLPTGTMVQPQFFLYGLLRSGVQTFNNGVDPATTQWVNSLQLFANFNATPTERLLIEFRPLDNTTKFSGYNWQPTTGPNSGWQNALNGRLYTLFFEGNFLSLFPGLDNGKSNLLGFDFSIGRQLLFLQSGVLINDNIDMVSITRPSLFSLGSSAATGSLIYAWGNIHRNGGFVSDSAQLIGGFLRSDYRTSTLELDAFYSPANQAAGGDGYYAAASAIQRIGKFNANLTAAGSLAPNRLTPNQTTVNNGALIFAQLSTDAPGTENIIYLDAFLAIDTFTSASRAADAGGPLGQTGLLFGATGLGNFGAALANTATNSAGAALGYQIFFDKLYRKQLTLEVGAQGQTTGATQNAVAAGIQYEQAFGRNWVAIIGAEGALQQNKGPLSGLRLELDLNF